MSFSVQLLVVVAVLLFLFSFELKSLVMSFRFPQSFPHLKRLANQKLPPGGGGQHRWLTVTPGRATALRGISRTIEVGASVLLKSSGSGVVSELSKYGWCTVKLDGAEVEVSQDILHSLKTLAELIHTTIFVD